MFRRSTTGYRAGSDHDDGLTDEPDAVGRPDDDQSDDGDPAAERAAADEAPDPTDLLIMEGRRRRAVTPLTRVLALLLVGGLGIFIGAKIQKSQASTTQTSLPAGFPSGFTLPTGAGGGGAGGLPNLSALAAAGGGLPGAGAGGNGSNPFSGSGAAGLGGAGGGTFGTVKLVDGNNIYIQDLSGNVTKVTANADATITVSKPGTASDLRPGQTVTVQGTKGSDGTIAATSISGTGTSTAAAPTNTTSGS
jgi:hypothetical protein